MQEFKDQMQHALETEESPLDANLESVLPGVHQWHTANHSGVQTVEKKVDAFALAVATGLHDIKMSLETKLEDMKQSTVETRRALTHAFLNIASQGN